MIESEFESGDHLSSAALAALASVGASAPGAEAAAAHLARCRRCMGIFAELVDAHAHHLADRTAETVDREWLDRGLAVADEGVAPAGVPDPRRRRARVGLALAALVLLATATLFMWRGRHPGTPVGVSAELQAILGDELRGDADGGLVYLENLPPRPRAIRGAAPATAALAGLDSLARQYDPASASADVSYWLVAGLLATNQRYNAEAHLRALESRHAGDARFHNLAAILAYKNNQPERAAAELRQGLAADRTPVTLVNLAIVRRQQGSESEAQALLRQALTRFPQSPLAPYAQELAHFTPPR